MTIKYKIRDRALLLPDDHLLPTYQKNHPTYDMTFDPIYKAVGAYAPERYFVDVGANVGDTAIVMRHNAKNPILCVEGHSQFLLYLRENIEGVADIRIVPAFIGIDELKAPLGYSSHGGTGRIVVASVEESTPVLKPRSLRSILEEEEVLRSGIAVFKTDTDGMDAFILQEFLDLEQPEAAIFFECDVRQTILPERGHALWHSVFSTLKERGYSLIIFDNFGYQIASCSVDHYDLVHELIAYVEAQFSHQSVHLYYLDIWAFPPTMAAIFEGCRTRAFASAQDSDELHVQKRREARQQSNLPGAAHRRAVFFPAGSITQPDQSKWHTDSGGDDTKVGAQIMNERLLDDWSHCRAEMSDLYIDLSRANNTIQEQRRSIELLSNSLAELKQKSSHRIRPFRFGWDSARFWERLKK
jgi:FkbM family methyltransferase